MDRTKYLAKNVGVLTISNFASKILVFLLVPLYTSVLSKDEVGIYDLVVSSAALLFPIFSLNILDALMRFLMDKSKSKEEVATIGIKYVIISLLPIFVFLIFAAKIEIFRSIQGLELLIFLYYISNCFNQYCIQFAKGEELVFAMSVSGIIGTATMLIANIFFLLIVKIGLTGFFIANILGQAVPSVYLFFKTKLWRFINSKNINKSLQKEMLIYCMPLIATAIGWWINSTSDKYIVVFFVGVGANGLLSVAYKIPQIINTLQGIFIQAWQISAIKEYGESNTAKFYGRAFCFINLLMCIACSILIVLTKPIGSILYQKEFYEAWQYVPFLLLTCVLNSASGFLGPILSAKKDSKSMALSSVIGAITNIIFNIVFICLIGIQGVCISTVISSAIIFVLRQISVKKEICINNYIIIILTWALLMIQATLEIYTSLWILEVLIMISILIINLKGIKEMSSVIGKLINSLKKH